MRIQLSDHFEYKRILRFVAPSIFMMIFTSIYSVVDGLFVSNFVGKTSFAAINLMMPLFIILGALGFMLGTGGNAVVSHELGKGDPARANRIFSFLVYTTIVIGVAVTLLGEVFLKQTAILLGAEGAMLESCILYGRIILIGNTFFMLQNIFQAFFITGEKPKLGLLFTVLAGVTNMILDALFVGLLGFGLAGAAWATITSQFVGGCIPFFYFARKNDSLLRLGKTHFMGRVLVRSSINGSSELMSNIAASIVTILYNEQLIKYAGENGVAAFGVVMYLDFIFVAIFLGYSFGLAPVIGFHFGAADHDELKSLLRKSVILLGIAGIAMATLSLSGARLLSGIFVGYDADLYKMTLHGMIIYSFHFLLCGFNIFASSFFTALGDGLVSAIISFIRSLILQVAAILIMPLLWGLDGIWYAVLVVEVLSLAVAVWFLVKKKDKYHYA